MTATWMFLILGGGGCGSDGEPDVEPTDSGTSLVFFRDVKPIIDGRCVTCHVDGGIAPIDLSVPALVASTASLIGAQIQDDIMPPWHAGEGCNTYKHNRSLTPDQKATILGWIDGGMPMGDPADRGTPLSPVEQGLPRVDLRIQPAEAYTPEGTDDYRCFVVPWPETSTRFVTGYNLEPTNPAVVHHANLYVADPASADTFQTRAAAAPGPGFPCFGGVFEVGVNLLGAWAPGSIGLEFPEDTGIQVEPGSVVVIEMHFNTGPSRQGPDRSVVALKLADQVGRRAVIAPFWDFVQWSQNRNMNIPAGEPDVMHQTRFDPNGFLPTIAPWLTSRAIQIWGTGLHMHHLGSRASIHVVRENDTRDCLIEIPRWDFNWQYGYLLESPMDFFIGVDRFDLECHWDNTVANQPIVDGQRRPVRDVNWGARSEDEMCIGYTYLTER